MEKEYQSKPLRGFLLGKFLPPHKGHEYLCNFAANYVENLTILVCSLKSEPISGELRFKWMTEMFPNCNVVWCDEELPQYPEEHPDFWMIWNDVIRKYSEELPDVIFASEPYGDRLAADFGAQFVPCDVARTALSCSGTAIRNAPFENWKFIPDVVKPYYVKRICLAGVESTGKSTLAKWLAAQMDTVCIPEYGRTYTEFFGTDVGHQEIRKIVDGHTASQKALMKYANRFIIEDTDPIMSAVWSDMLVGERDAWFDTFNDYADLYVLCDIDIPWINDGTRYFPDDASRMKFHDKIEKELIDRKVNYVKVSGEGNTRNVNAWHKIEEFFKNAKN